MPPTQRDSAFTLTELLLLIVLIAISAAILLPALRHMREYARRDLCQANLKRIFMALNTYIQDCGQVLPEVNCVSGVTGNNWYQVLALKGYVKDRRVFLCPSDPYPNTFNSGPDPAKISNSLPVRGL